MVSLEVPEDPILVRSIARELAHAASFPASSNLLLRQRPTARLGSGLHPSVTSAKKFLLGQFDAAR